MNNCNPREPKFTLMNGKRFILQVMDQSVKLPDLAYECKAFFYNKVKNRQVYSMIPGLWPIAILLIVKDRTGVFTVFCFSQNNRIRN